MSQSSNGFLKKLYSKCVGGDVVYNQPNWVKKELEEGRKILKENAEIDGFQIPADRSPGVGANKIRKRRTRFVKEINYDLAKH